MLRAILWSLHKVLGHAMRHRHEALFIRVHARDGTPDGFLTPPRWRNSLRETGRHGDESQVN